MGKEALAIRPSPCETRSWFPGARRLGVKCFYLSLIAVAHSRSAGALTCFGSQVNDLCQGMREEELRAFLNESGIF